MKLFRQLRQHPLQVINYTELLFAFVAHVITIPFIGVLTGLICGCAVHYTIQIQADGKKPATRKQAFYGTLLFKIGQLWIHQTSFLFMFQVSGKVLPFGWELDVWAWVTTVFIFSIDVWALSVTSQEAAEKAEAIAEEESFARVTEREEKERQARLERERLATEERLALARIHAETKERTKLAAEETARKIAEEQRKADGMKVELERIRLETEWKNAEAVRKSEEEARNLAETRRKEEESERKRVEAERKQEELEKREREAKIRAESEVAEKAAEAKRLADIEAQRAKWRIEAAKKAEKKQMKINGHQAETETAQIQTAEA